MRDSVIATMSSLESKEHNTSFDRVGFFVKLLILRWKRKKTFILGSIEHIIHL